MNRVDTFLELLIKQNGSDLHLIAGNVPRMRIFGDIHPIKYRQLSPSETQELLFNTMTERHIQLLKKRGNVDYSYTPTGNTRFRVNVFKHNDGLGGVFRAIPMEIPQLEQLHLPPVVKALAQQAKGLILTTGPTGSGKSTTMAAMIDYINSNKNGHIITIEDPVEFVHKNKKCLVSQREVGEHTRSFVDALHCSLREDPNVILVGEMRDQETIGLAITAAELGILVLGTLHTNGAAAAIDRIINAFNPGEEPYIRTMLSTSLRGIISQQLIKTADGKGRVAAAEVLINNSATANLIREGKTEQLENVIQSGSVQGMQTLDRNLRRLLDSKQISGNDAYKLARNKKMFEQYRSTNEAMEAESSVFQ
ncbi:MAG: type IV pilus twitching motility protein PilT [Gammaproteobacteria bacterium]|nr:type IV pilus twitching motility protein PilT [Gammaproteobacteria bacterium]MDH5799357.1 type IV pilus twitching motility protein PilT [Gammaproteobacteria bacterium]